MTTFLRRLATIAIRPRTTMREILGEPRDRAVIALVVLASLSSFASNFNQNVRGDFHGLPTWVVAVCGAIIAAMLLLAFFFFFAWIAFMAGRFLEGEGTHREVRSAIAWGLAPVIWALLYRFPAALLGISHVSSQMNVGHKGVHITPGSMQSGCFIALIYGALELGVLVWYLAVASRTLAEAHRFSAWRGFGTLVIVGITPLVITIAAVLAIR